MVKLNELENVKEVHGTFRAYDITAKLEAETTEKLSETITQVGLNTFKTIWYYGTSICFTGNCELGAEEEIIGKLKELENVKGKYMELLVLTIYVLQSLRRKQLPKSLEKPSHKIS